MENIGIILAGSNDTRFNSNKSKHVHKLFGKEIIRRVFNSVKEAGIEKIATVVGEKKEQIQEVLKDETEYIYQEKVFGTGHAIIKSREFLEGKNGKVLIINGDTPLIEPSTIKKLMEKAEENAATFLTAIYSNPKGYGRVVRNEYGDVIEIVEEEFCDNEQKLIQEINSGIYCFDIKELQEALEELVSEDGKYYITDIIKIMKQKELKVEAMILEDNTEILGVNDRIQLELLNKILKIKINTKHMKNGVTIEDMQNTYIYDDVKIGKDTIIHPNTIIKSNVIIGDECEIGPNAYIREGCNLANKVKIGNCVEIKKAIIGEGTKIPHLSYMGDCEIGQKCNIGCGTITCNYDGFNKSKTIIGNNTFVGSNVNLVAPVKLGDNTFVAAGSTITDDVPEYSLAIARQRQVNKEGWNKRN